MKKRVVITGMGAVSAYGLGVDAFWQGLVANTCTMKELDRFKRRSHNYRSYYSSEVPEEIREDKTLQALANHPIDDATLYASLSAIEAVKQSGLDLNSEALDRSRLSCMLGTLCAGSKNIEYVDENISLEELEQQIDNTDINKIKNSVSLDIDNNSVSLENDISNLVPDSAKQYLDDDLQNLLEEKVKNTKFFGTGTVDFILQHIVDLFDLQGPSSLISTACASSTDCIGWAADLIRTDKADVVLAGGGDVSSEIVHYGFNKLFSVTPNTPKPFDAKRDGFFIGEGGGMLVVESLEHALARGANILAEISGYGLSNNAYHLTATSKDGYGEGLSVERALADAQLDPNKVDYINTHGTATISNDRTEIQVIKRLFKDNNKLKVNSIKPMIGHCMGAAGILEAVSVVKSINESFIPATLFTEGSEKGVDFDLVKENREAEINHALSESFGFGGACAAILLSKYEK